MTVVPDISFAFQPLLSTRTGDPVAIEALARPGRGGLYDLFRRAAKAGTLAETDIALARQAVEAVAECPNTEGPGRLPLHLNLLAVTATKPQDVLRELRPALTRVGSHPSDVVLEITPPFSRVHRAELINGLAELRAAGFRVAFDSVGDGDLPLSLLADVHPDLVKIDAHLIGGLPGEPGCVAVVECLSQFCTRTGVRLAAVGVENEEQLLTLNRIGIRLAQGSLLTCEADGDSTMPLPRPVAEIIEHSAVAAPATHIGVPLVADFLRTATTMSDTATAGDVQDVFAEEPTINGIVLVDTEGRPTHSLDRSRFLTAVTGLYGHALNAKKPAARHADSPRVISADATGLQLLEMVNDADWERTGDDVVVVDADRVCVGVVRLTEVVRGVAEAQIEQAAALNPLTRLPGSEVVDREIDRRIERDQMFVVAWLDIDAFKTVNDTVGFAAGDDLIRAIGRALTDAERELPGVRVAHVGGDDFLIVTELDEIAQLAARTVDQPWSVEGMDVSVSLASLVCGVRSVRSFREASRLLAPLKKKAKAVSGSSWVLTRPDSDRVEILRGRGAQPAGRHEHRPQHALTPQ